MPGRAGICGYHLEAAIAGMILCLILIRETLAGLAAVPVPGSVQAVAPALAAAEGLLAWVRVLALVLAEAPEALVVPGLAAGRYRFWFGQLQRR